MTFLPTPISAHSMPTLDVGDLPLGPDPLLTDVKGCRDNQFDLLNAVKLTVPQGAKALGLGETKMRELIRNGGIPVVKIMGKTLLLARDLDEYLRAGYGRLSHVKQAYSRLPPLPKHVRNSMFLNRAS